MKRLPRLLWLLAALAAAGAPRAEEHLLMGVFPRYKPTDTFTMYGPLAEHIGTSIRRKVTLVTAKDFESFWQEVTAQRYDIVHYNQYHYTHSAHAYQVIARNQEFGKDAVAGALFVRKDSGITQVSQLRGRVIIFGGGRDAMLSYIAPMYLLMQAGLKEGDFETRFAINPPNTLLALYHRQADAAGGGGILIDLPPVRKAVRTEEITVLARTEPLLFLPWAVKRSMPARLRERIRAAMVDLEKSEAGRKVLKAANTTALRRAEDRDYEEHRRMISAVFGPRRK